jgi:hypothetical protein
MCIWLTNFLQSPNRVAGKTEYPHAKKRSCTPLLYHTQKSIKWIKDLKIRPEVIKILKENRRNLLDIGGSFYYSMGIGKLFL